MVRDLDRIRRGLWMSERGKNEKNERDTGVIL